MWHRLPMIMESGPGTGGGASGGEVSGQAGFVGGDDELGAVAGLEFHRQAPMCDLTVPRSAATFRRSPRWTARRRSAQHFPLPPVIVIAIYPAVALAIAAYVLRRRNA